MRSVRGLFACLAALGARTAVVLLALAALPLGAQDVETGLFDEETGLWFPPGMAKEAFIDGTAPRPYPLAVRDRLATDEPLRQQVCDWMASPRNEVSREKAGARVLQMKTMAAMVCASIPGERESRRQREEQGQRLEKSWREALDLDAARQLDRAERGRRAEQLFATIENVPPGEERVKTALGALGLWPQNDAYLLAVYEAFLNRSTIPGQHFERFLRTLFTEESRSDGGEGRRWQLGLRNVHYFAGELVEARRITADALARPFLDQHDFDRVYLAVLDRALGDRRTWDALLLDCRAPEAFLRDKPPDSPAVHYCWTVARNVVWQGIRMLGEKTPSALAEILVEGIAAEPTSWGDRMESIRMLRRVDRRIAAREAEAVLAIPFTLSPPGAQYDAVAVLAGIARDEKDSRRAIAALDRYLDLLGFKVPNIPPDVWTRLRGVGKLHWEYKPPEYGALDFIRWALAEKVTAAAEANDLATARGSVTVRLATELELDAAKRKELEVVRRELGETSPAELAEVTRQLEARLKESLDEAAASVRHQLVQVGRACQRSGDRPGALRIAGFLYNQPNEEGPGIVTNLSSFKIELERDGPAHLRDETSPWEPPPASPKRRAR
jgi:hypothetical protein